MRHAAHKAAKVSHAQFSLSKALFTANRGSHTAKAVRMAQLAEGGAVVGLAPEVVASLFHFFCTSLLYSLLFCFSSVILPSSLRISTYLSLII